MGQVIVGGAVAMFDTKNEQVALFPAPSTAVHVTLVLPYAKVYPDVRAESNCPQLIELMPFASEADTENVTITFVSTPSFGETDTIDGQVNFGGTESRMMLNSGQL